MWIIRDVQSRDLAPLFQLAQTLNTLNLPANREVIRALIEESRGSARVSREEEPQGARRGKLVFVLERWTGSSQALAQGGDQGWAREVLGSSMIIPQHGTHERPASYFQLMERQKYSPILKRHFKHQTLELIFDYDGPTELGGLVISPSLRGHPLKLGRFLSYARLALIAQPQRRPWFQDEVVAELLPALGPNRDSELWPYLGQRFTGLDYHTADKLSREHIHFIQELFPQAPLYTSLLPEHIQAQLGQVGPDSQPAAHLLSKVGFRFDGTIDPFDGGPTYRVKTDECELVRRSRDVTHLELLPAREGEQPGVTGALLFDELDEGGGVKVVLGEALPAPPPQRSNPHALYFRPADSQGLSERALWSLLSPSPRAHLSFTPFEWPLT